MLKRFFARRALRQRGICPDHIKPLNIHRGDPEHPGWFSVLCEDCLPEFDRRDAARLSKLLNTVRRTNA